MSQDLHGAGKKPNVADVDNAVQGNDADSSAATIRRAWWASAFMIALGVIVIVNIIYALPRYLSFDPALSRTRIDPSFPLHAHFAIVVLHVVAGNIALITMFVQFVPWIRRRHPAIHRISGRIYVFCGAVPASLLAFALLPPSTAPMGKIGLLTMAVLWIVTSLTGWRMARLRRYKQHRRFMVYSFALALGTSWGRIISLFATPGMDMDLALFFDISSWAGWVVSLVVAHWWLDRTARRPAV